MKKEIKLDKAYVKHSKASEHDPKVWWYEELEGEILEYANDNNYFIPNKNGLLINKISLFLSFFGLFFYIFKKNNSKFFKLRKLNNF